MSPCPPFFRVIAAALLCCAVASVPACARNPVTGRPQAVFMSEEEEIEIGKKGAEQLKEMVQLLDESSELVSYVRQVGARVAQQSPRKGVAYTFNVVDVTDPNAFALPGGPVYVTRGLLPLLNSEDELANVLGHEVIHIAARHQVSSDVRRKLLAGPALLGTLAGAVVAGEGGAQLASLAGAGLIASHNRGQEREADEQGERLAAAAGWDPEAMGRFLRTMDRAVTLQTGEEQKGSFLATHPDPGERARESLERARSLARGSGTPLDRAAFLEHLRGVVIGQDPKQGMLEKDNTFLHPDLGLRIRFPELWQAVNAPAFVGAFEIGGGGWVIMELQGEAKEPAEAAKDWLSEERERVNQAIARGDRSEQPLRIKKRARRDFHRRKAYWVEATFQQERGTAALYWLAIHDKMFRITCVAATELYTRGYGRDCDATARSLRRIRRSELERIKLTSLDVAAVKAGDTLEAFNTRTDNSWSTSETAVMNGLEQGAALQAGQLLKIARERTYTAPPPSAAGKPTPAPRDADDADDAEEAD